MKWFLWDNILNPLNCGRGSITFHGRMVTTLQRIRGFYRVDVQYFTNSTRGRASSTKSSPRMIIPPTFVVFI